MKPQGAGLKKCELKSKLQRTGAIKDNPKIKAIKDNPKIKAIKDNPKIKGGVWKTSRNGAHDAHVCETTRTQLHGRVQDTARPAPKTYTGYFLKRT